LRKRASFAAKIAGLNLIRGTYDGRAVTDAGGRVVEGHGDGRLRAGEPAVAVFRPSAVSVFLHPPGGSPRNNFPVAVAELEPLGDVVRIRSARLSADVTAAAVADLKLQPGTDVHFVVKASEVDIYPT
jgi:molybdate transport system ATP-binding protein